MIGGSSGAALRTNIQGGWSAFLFCAASFIAMSMLNCDPKVQIPSVPPSRQFQLWDHNWFFSSHHYQKLVLKNV